MRVKAINCEFVTLLASEYYIRYKCIQLYNVWPFITGRNVEVIVTYLLKSSPKRIQQKRIDSLCTCNADYMYATFLCEFSEFVVLRIYGLIVLFGFQLLDYFLLQFVEKELRINFVLFILHLRQFSVCNYFHTLKVFHHFLLKQIHNLSNFYFSIY